MERTAPLLILLRPREVHQDPTHQPRRNGEEVRAILPLHAADVDQPQVGLVDEGSGLEQWSGRSPAMCRLPIRRNSSWTSGISF